MAKNQLLQELREIEGGRPYKEGAYRLDFSEMMSEAMDAKQVTEKQLSKATGLSRKKIFNILHDDRDFRLSEMTAISIALGFTIKFETNTTTESS